MWRCVLVRSSIRCVSNKSLAKKQLDNLVVAHRKRGKVASRVREQARTDFLAGVNKKLAKHMAVHETTAVLTNGATIRLRTPYWDKKYLRLEDDYYTARAREDERAARELAKLRKMQQPPARPLSDDGAVEAESSTGEPGKEAAEAPAPAAAAAAAAAPVQPAAPTRLTGGAGGGRPFVAPPPSKKNPAAKSGNKKKK